jgi:hypothetical protein
MVSVVYLSLRSDLSVDIIRVKVKKGTAEKKQEILVTRVVKQVVLKT